MSSYEFWQSIASTPWWYALIISYVVVFAFLSAKTRVITINNKNMLIMPILFIATSIPMLVIAHQFTLKNVLIWFAGAFIGGVIGWIQLRFSNIRAIRGQNKLHVPGSWNIFIIIAMLIAAKYYFGFSFTIDLQTLSNLNTSQTFFWLSGSYGLLSGILVGKILYCNRCVKVGPFLTQRYDVSL